MAGLQWKGRSRTDQELQYQEVTAKERSFYRLSLVTLIAVYLLILIGGVVRSTGSGMGCPDWPTCFGNWVPPVSAEELPENYKEIYSEYRHRKNERFAKYLEAFGFRETASRILTDASIREEADFNAVRTWIEYFNRLTGVIIGLLIFAVFVASLQYRKSKPRITVIALLTFLLVGFQGWIGSVVVSTNLTPWTITVHMFLALVIVALLVYLVYQSRRHSFPVVQPYLLWWLIACITVLLSQILFGTRVREEVDQVSSVLARDFWITNLGNDFILHRAFSWVVLISHAGLVFTLVKTGAYKNLSYSLIALVLISVASGAGMAYFNMPAFLQPVHLLIATMAFGIQMYLLLALVDRKYVAITS